MDYVQFGNKYILRLDKGEEVVETLTKFCTDKNITLGWINGIGAINEATIGLFDTNTKEYYAEDFNGLFEITSLFGNVSTMNGDTYLHLHITISDEKHKAYGGHLNRAVISATGEIVIDKIEGQVDREFSDEIGLNLFKFD